MSRLETIQSEIDAHGIDSGLALLNAGVPHRYSGVYELDRSLLRNRHLIDKRGEVLPSDLLEVPLHASFCQFVLRDGFFRTADSAAEQVLDGHPYQGVVVSYTGVPLADAEGRLVGTLCHFDTASWHLTEDEYALLHSVAKLIGSRLAATRGG